jgi:hypothetical protein
MESPEEEVLENVRRCCVETAATALRLANTIMEEQSTEIGESS